MIYYDSSDGQLFHDMWNDVIEETYIMLKENQCETTGLYTNWWVPSRCPYCGNGGTAGCGGSGTSSAEYGSEAGRTVWRVMLDALWYDSPDAIMMNDRVVEEMNAKVPTQGNLGTPSSCAVQSIHPDWYGLMFMFGPSVSSLVYPHSNLTNASAQQNAIDIAGDHLQSHYINTAVPLNATYYRDSWNVIATFTLAGDVARLKSVITNM